MLLSSAAARAAPGNPGVELGWVAPPGCPGEAAVRAEIERLAGRSLGAGTGATLHAAAVVSHGPRGWRAKIALIEDGELPREREIEGETCAEVADAAAVIVALAIDSAAGVLPPPPLSVPLPPPPLSEPLPPPLPHIAWRPRPPAFRLARPEARPAARSASPRRAAKSFDLGFKTMGGVDFRSLPAPAVGFGLGAFVSLSRNRIEVFVAGWLPEVAAAPQRPYAGADISLVVGGARYCRLLVGSPLGLAGCGGIEIGAMTATSFGVPVSGAGSALWLAPELGVLGLLNPSHTVSLSFELTGLAPSTRQAFWITGLGEVYRPPALTGRAVLGVEAHFR